MLIFESKCVYDYLVFSWWEIRRRSEFKRERDKLMMKFSCSISNDYEKKEASVVSLSLLKTLRNEWDVLRVKK